MYIKWFGAEAGHTAPWHRQEKATATGEAYFASFCIFIGLTRPGGLRPDIGKYLVFYYYIAF